MSEVVATIGEDLVNTTIGRISLSGEKNWSGKIDIPLLPDDLDPKWSVTVKFRVDGLRATLEEGRVRILAKVHVEAGPLSYTDDVETSTEAAVDGSELLLRVTSVKVGLYVAPFGNRIDLGEVDVCGIIPCPLEIRLKVLPDPYVVSLPGGAQVTLSVSNPRVTIHPGKISVGTDITAV